MSLLSRERPVNSLLSFIYLLDKYLLNLSLVDETHCWAPWTVARQNSCSSAMVSSTFHLTTLGHHNCGPFCQSSLQVVTQYLCSLKMSPFPHYPPPFYQQDRQLLSQEGQGLSHLQPPPPSQTRVASLKNSSDTPASCPAVNLYTSPITSAVDFPSPTVPRLHLPWVSAVRLVTWVITFSWDQQGSLLAAGFPPPLSILPSHSSQSGLSETQLQRFPHQSKHV